MTSHRNRTSRNLGTLALQAPFVATHRLTNGLASGGPLKWWFDWQALAWEKWFAGVEVAGAIANATWRLGPRSGSAAITQLVDASLVPVARRVRRNARAIRRRVR